MHRCLKTDFSTSNTVIDRDDIERVVNPLVFTSDCSFQFIQRVRAGGMNLSCPPPLEDVRVGG